MHRKPNLAIYYNPAAGSGQAERVWQEVQNVLAKREITYTTLTKGITVSEISDIVVIGGDGTFNSLLNSLQRPHNYRFILLPAGTSNSLCSQLSPGQKPLDKLEAYLSGGTFRSMDLPELTVNGKTWRFINEASAGFAAAIAREIEGRSTKQHFHRLGLHELAYIATAFRCWGKDDSVMISLCNNSRISGDLYPCPEAQVDDGNIDVFELRCPRVLLPVELMRLVKAKRAVRSRYMLRKQVSAGSWVFDKPLPVEVDGNPIGKTNEMRLSLYSASIEVL